METSNDHSIKIGISACLLGDRVRYDGGHARNHFFTETLVRFVDFVPVCPEVDIGLGTPRETIRLAQIGEKVRLVAPKSGADHTFKMQRYAKKKVCDLLTHDLNGFIFKKNSPSCGLYRVKIYDKNALYRAVGRGVFADTLTSLVPLLPVEEEGRLNDPRLRENFFEQVFAHRRLCKLFQTRWKLVDLITFQASEKLLLKAHSPQIQRELGKLVAQAKTVAKPHLAEKYKRLFMESLRKPVSVGRHVNILHHIAGPLNKTLSSQENSELVGAIQDYRSQLVPLIVPITLVRHFTRRYEINYLMGQTYLEPHPKELLLRNHT